MSFSSNVKAELCKDSLSKKTCAVAEGYGVLLYCNTFSSTEIRIITESRDFAARLPRLFKKAFGITFDQEPAAQDRGKLQFAISSEDKIAKIFETLQMDLKASLTLHVNFGMLEEEAECMAYLRGAFLAGGSITDPAKRYHLEMTTSHYKVSRETCALLIECGFSPKELSRGGNNILYFKQSDYIEDFLTAIGAQVSHPDKVVLHITGDGGFRMNCNELATEQYYNLPIINIVFNNGTLGMVRQWQTLIYDKHYEATTLDRAPDFVKLAEAYGLSGRRVRNQQELEEAIQEALQCGHGYIIDCMIDIDEKVRPMVGGGSHITEFMLN